MKFINRRGFSSGFNGIAGYIGNAVRTIILINVLVFIGISFFPGPGWYSWFGLVPATVFSKLRLWQFVSYLFVHANFWHLVLNMLMLGMFGSVIENNWGRNRFLAYYFLTGIGAGICSFLFASSSLVPVVGASGAIFGILVAYALMFPDNIIFLFFVLPMKMKHAVLFLAGINLLGAVSSGGASVAYVAHLGGGVIGYFYLKKEWFYLKLRKLKVSNIRSLIKKKQELSQQLRQEKMCQEVDRILDKISAQGVNSLSKEEREILERKSRS